MFDPGGRSGLRFNGKVFKDGIIGAWNAGCKGQHTYAAQRAGKHTGSVKGCCGMGSTGFFALAFYLIREEKDTLADMENGQRNQFLSDYLKENFTDRYADSIEAAGLKEDMDAFIRMIHAIHN